MGGIAGGKRFISDVAAVARATPDDLAKLLTVIIRGDRFSEGEIAGAFKSGISGSILAEHDGPMLVVGLQEIHGTRIILPRRLADHPDPARLERRYAEFLQAG